MFIGHWDLRGYGLWAVEERASFLSMPLAELPAASDAVQLTAVVPIPGTKQLWAVGDCSPGLGNRTLVERRRNGAWHQVASPTPDSSGSFLTGVVALSKIRPAYMTATRSATCATTPRS